jgi:hypothetical protein
MRTIRTLLALLVAAGVLAAPALATRPSVKWRALADDGHHESGSWTFQVS